MFLVLYRGRILYRLLFILLQTAWVASKLKIFQIKGPNIHIISFSTSWFFFFSKSIHNYIPDLPHLHNVSNKCLKQTDKNYFWDRKKIKTLFKKTNKTNSLSTSPFIDDDTLCFVLPVVRNSFKQQVAVQNCKSCK